MSVGIGIGLISLLLCGAAGGLIAWLWRLRRRTQPSASVRLGANAAASTAPLALPLPESLGPYRIEKLLGRGSMGRVYLGRDAASGQAVALKSMALSQEFDAEQLSEAQRRFFWEAEAAARLQHTGIVEVYGSGEDQGLAWIAMEFIDAQPLSNWTQPERLLALPQALAVVRQCALALDYAHRQQVVHRDVKPANVLFLAETGKIKLMDFGVARLTDANRTRTGRVLGTPAFMSPEQLAGKHIDGRSDLFSLGVMLYQLLTGQLPFVGASLGELMYAITHHAAPDPRLHTPMLPAAVAAIVMKSLQKEPDRRFQTGAQFALALARSEAAQKRRISHA